MSSDLGALAVFAEELADTARQIIRDAVDAGFSHELKADGSPVTEVDKAVESALRALIAERHPGHGVVGEEFGVDRGSASHLWVIDPIDGTRQFIAGLPLYGSLIALARDGRFVLGVMDFPASLDRWVGGQGLPARYNGRTVAARPCTDPALAVLAAGNPLRGTPAERSGRMALAQASASTHWDGSSYAFGLVANGGIDLAVDTGLDTYDFAAAVAVVEAAGGAATDWQGRPLTLESGSQVLFAGDPSLIGPARRYLEAG